MNIEDAKRTIQEMAEAIEFARIDDMDELDDLREMLEGLASSAEEKHDELDAYSIKTEDEAREAYDAMLDECYPVPEDSPHWLRGSSAADAMRENDPTAYRCGFNDWIDSMEKDGQIPPEGRDWCSAD